MDILKTAIDWAKAEVFSSVFFVLFGIMFVLASLGFWQFGKTEISKAYIIPTLVAGVLLLIIGIGIFFPSQSRITSFSTTFNSDALAFVASEIVRVDKVLNDYRIAVFRVFPLVIAVCAVLVIFLDTPIWRASLITTIAMIAVILVIDTNANARLEIYREQLALVKKQE